MNRFQSFNSQSYAIERLKKTLKRTDDTNIPTMQKVRTKCPSQKKRKETQLLLLTKHEMHISFHVVSVAPICQSPIADV